MMYSGMMMMNASPWSLLYNNLFGKKEDTDSNAIDSSNERKIEAKTSAAVAASSHRQENAIIKRIWNEITSENMIARFTRPTKRAAGSAWTKLCHRCDASYPPSKQLSIIDMFATDNVMMLTQMRYALRHSVAAYPAEFMLLSSLFGPSRDQMDKFAFNMFQSLPQILDCSFNIPSHDVIVDNISNNMGNKVHDPAFYLVVDRARSLIVLSIRGTVSMADGLTDADCIAEEYSKYGIDGYVHPGILCSAKAVMKRVNCSLLSLCQKFKDFQVIFTGHSLGAGVAAMLGFLYRDHPIIFKENRLHCFAFASPPVVSREFVNIGKRNITAVALSTDMVTRLSVESVKKMNIRLDIIRQYIKEDNNIIDQCLQNIDDDDADDMKEENPKWSQLLRELKEAQSPNPQQQLFPLGKILWFVPKEVMVDSDKQRRESLLCFDDSPPTTIGLGETFKNMAKKSRLMTEKKRNKYDGSNYVLCDASNCRHVFQEFVRDMPESFFAHYPIRYMLACQIKL